MNKQERNQDIDQYAILLKETEEALRSAVIERDRLQKENQKLKETNEALYTEKESWRLQFEDIYNSRSWRLIRRINALLGKD